MMKLKEKKRKKISNKIADLLIDHLNTIDLEYREYAINSVFVTSFKILRDSLGDQYAKECLLEVMELNAEEDFTNQSSLH